MSKTILFSPVGGTDPISNQRDGSLIHICRVYRPDRVVLFMSKEITAFHERDNRYVFCLEQLGNLQDRYIEHEIISEPELDEVQNYNYFYKRFRECIRTISEEMSEGDRLIVNVSSGTPAMKSALQVIAAIAEYRFLPVQVSTPERGMNKVLENRDDYTPEEQWEYNLDNLEEEFVNRCTEVECQNLLLLLKIDSIKKFLQAYDYSAARVMADEIRSDISERAYAMITAAEARIQLDRSSMNKCFLNAEKEFIPVQSGNQRNIMEYMLALGVKLKRKEYADFIRGLTPVVVDLFEWILECQCGFVLDDYCAITKRGKNNIRRWDRSRLESDPGVWEIFSMAFPGGFNGKEIYSIHLMHLIHGLSGDEKMKRVVASLREAEEQVRNIAAHEIVSVTDDWIRSMTGISAEKIYSLLKEACRYAGIPSGKQVWGSYKEMNEKILRELG